MLACWLLVAAGCEGARPTPLEQRTTNASPTAPPVSSNASVAVSSASPASGPAAVRDEHWEAVFLAGAKVGHVHTVREEVVENGTPLTRTSSTMAMSVLRAGQTVETHMTLTSWDQADGALHRFESTAQLGPTPTVTTGRVTGQRLIVTEKTGGVSQQVTLDWQAQYGGLFADVGSLRRQPLQPGEQRTLAAFIPIVNQVGTVELIAQDYETIKLLDGPRELLRIRSVTRAGPIALPESIVWADRDGVVWRTAMPAQQHESIRTTRERALAADAGPRFDLGDRSVVKLAAPLSQPHALQVATYEIRHHTGNARQFFATGPTQAVVPVDDHTVRVTVRSLRPGAPPNESALPSAHVTSFPAGAPPSEGDRKANSFVQSDHPAVVEFATTAAGQAPDDWSAAVMLERAVRQQMRPAAFSPALASAVDALQSGQGDCTEHAVLLAALLRARRIPARIAFGLVYVEAAGGFAYHMWTEAHLGDVWTPLDSTLAMGGIGAAHLKIGDSNLDGVGPLAAFLPVAEVLGQIDVKLIAAQ